MVISLKKVDAIPDKQLIFASFQIIANRMDTLLTRELSEFDMTTKQWFLLATIKSVFDNPPTMKAAAREMGSSHQNIKQVALKLEQKGLLSLQKNKEDARVTRLEMTEQSYEFLEKTQPRGTVFIEEVFNGIEKEDLSSTRVVLEKILLNLGGLENTTSFRKE